jgi:sugar lactone lactonase YvrE
MPNSTELELLLTPELETLRFLPEGPYAFRPGKISWVGIQHGLTSTVGSVNILDLATKTNQSYELPGRPGFAFATSRDGVLVVGCEREVGLFDTHSGTWQPALSGVDRGVENTIINDAVVFEDNLIFGCKDLEFATKKAGLYLYRGSDRSIHSLRNDQICSNGKAILQSDSGLCLFDIDSPTKKIVRYSLDIATASLSEPETVIDLTADPAVPDGMTLSGDGKFLFVSLYNPNPADHGQTRQFDASTGEHVHTFLTPGSPRNTCPQLVEFDGATWLIVTTAIEGMEPDERLASAHAGCLFWAKTDLNAPAAMPTFPIDAIE